MTRRVLGVLIIAVGPIRVLADDQPVMISTDRPAVANSSVVVPQGAFQLENGALSTDAAGKYVLDFPESEARYGLLPRTELRLTAPDYFKPTSSSSVSGFGDLALGVKQQLGPAGGFDVSIIGFLSFPTGSRAYSSGGDDPGLQLPWSRMLTSEWTTAGQLAAYWPTVNGQRDFTPEVTFLMDRQLSAVCDAFLEYAGDYPHFGGSREILHAGISYRPTPRQQIDFHAAAGLSSAAPRSLFGVGYSFILMGH